jgi:hypothetical protein
MPEQIVVHEKALGHLTRGLYRSPASAIRELVSNSWDANATQVRIETSRPSFHRIVVRDNGDGFSKADFRRLMAGFGNSEKRAAAGKELRFGRPTIGRLGIGLLGIAQICGSFLIRSRPRRGEPFTARVVLYDQLRTRIDVDDKDIVKQAAPRSRARGRRSRDVIVGQYDFIDNETVEEVGFGTVIESDDLIPTFSYAFRRTYEDITVSRSSKKPGRAPKETKRGPIPTTWLEFLERAASSATVQELGDYWRWIWDLSALCPIPYVNNSALPHRVVAEHHRRLLRYKFKVIVDGVEIRKPVYVRHANKGGFTARSIPPTKKRVMGRELAYSGYVFVQEGKQLKPAELRGALVRISEVGVGLYDPSFLDYRINEGPRTRWITSELFVERGLEDALNVDRDSFNRYSPEFQVLQRELHLFLQKDVFPEVYRQIDVRTEEGNRAKDKERLTNLRDMLKTAYERPVSVSTKRASARPNEAVLVKVSDSAIEISLSKEGLAGTARAQRSLGAALVAIYDLAQKERDSSERRDRFLSLLRQLLRKW